MLFGLGYLLCGPRSIMCEMPSFTSKHVVRCLIGTTQDDPIAARCGRGGSVSRPAASGIAFCMAMPRNDATLERCALICSSSPFSIFSLSSLSWAAALSPCFLSSRSSPQVCHARPRRSSAVRAHACTLGQPRAYRSCGLHVAGCEGSGALRCTLSRFRATNSAASSSPMEILSKEGKQHHATMLMHPSQDSGVLSLSKHHDHASDIRHLGQFSDPHLHGYTT